VTQYTYGGNPSAVLTTITGDVVPDYPLIVRAAGTGSVITALFEQDGTTPIAQLRTNDAASDTPGAIRTFKVEGFGAIEYEYNGPSGQPVRWYEVGREVPTAALEGLNSKLDTAGGTITGDLDVTGTLDAGTLLVGGQPLDLGANWAEAGIILPAATTGAAVQDALDEARDAGGGWVIIPPGDYDAGAGVLPLRIYDSTRLSMCDGAAIRRAGTGTMLLNGDASQSFGGYTGHGNIIIEGGVWDARADAYPTSAMCISIGHAENVIIRNTTIKDVCGYHAIELNSTKNGVIEQCRFLGYLDPGGRDFSEAVQIDLAKSSSVFGGFGPYDHTSCQDIEVRGCYIGASGTAGTAAWPRGVGSHSATIGTRHSGIRIIGNTFDGLSQYAVGGYDWRDTVVQGNTISGCGAGVRMRVVDTSDTEDTKNLAGTQTSASQDLRNITITGNTIRGTTGHDDAILLMGEATGKVLDATVTGNVIDGVTSGSQNGIRIEHAEQYTISGNLVRDTAGTGISQQNIVGSTITGNRVYAPTTSGISCDTGTGVTITGNSVRDAGVNGVHVLGGSDVQVVGNYIKGASRSAAGSWGIRCSTSADGLLITGNKIRKFGSGNEVAAGIGITSTCTNVRRYGNDLSDTGLDDQSTGPDTSPFDLGFGALENALRPSGQYETTSRLRCGTTSTPTSGTLYLVPIWLPKGLVISNISFVSGGTAAVTPTNWWFTLHDRSRVALARTADQLTAAWAANTIKTLAIAQATAGSASSYTTTYGGLHHLGVMIKATTVCNLVSEGSLTDVLASVSPGFGGTDTGLSTPPTVTAGAFTAGAFGAGSGILLHGYTT
jgi:hypothetical protein